ncbi:MULTISPECIES: NAD-dependent succinate-semialdehyde dehydrogenase [unclassified Nocardioides]|uniref:NAD-dependent succinate-semialdehyde dehydrogenase n=1 Tax=unclassified Nocardioides TaxID=2615069 RepID=UPI000057012A|nr:MULTISPECIES: NAD-dependent succinate-semialdehyde dehydrogenase [unclassified Nocardioides]ABL83685.1 aldehyde dehydrogenase [Nocardioides sp. JS614]
MYAVTNPATGELISEFDTATDAQVREAVSRADLAFQSWKSTPLEERSRTLARAADLFLERSDELARAITQEMGKRLEESRGEVRIASDIFHYYSDNAPKLLADETIAIQGGEAKILKRPVGVLLGIMPWNYPYYQVARFAAPNLVLGNTIILKHAPSCPQSSALVEQLLHDAGVPVDAYINVYATNEQVAWALADPRIQGVSVTGSERAGAAVAAEAGRNLKKVVLELGGSDPMVILDTDDLDALVETAMESRMGNTGQACNAPKRMIVVDELYDDFVTKMVQAARRLQPGDPLDPETTLAPLSSEQAAVRLIGQLDEARNQGATIRVGGHRVERPGAYVEPTVITDVTPEMSAYRDELFGPVAIIFRVDDEDDAVRLANDTPFGLGASVFSGDSERAERVAARIDAGMVYLNQAGGSQPDLPFGGIKRSGIGRELGALGIEEFMNKKVVRL